MMKGKKIDLKDVLKSDKGFLEWMRQKVQSEEYRALKIKAEKGPHPTVEILYDYILDWADSEDAVEDHIEHCGICIEEVIRIVRVERELQDILLECADTPLSSGSL